MTRTTDWQSYVDTGIYPRRTYLFLDDLGIEETDGVRRVVTTPRKVADGPVMKPEMPWEGVAFIFRNGLIFDHQERVFKFWYPSPLVGTARCQPKVGRGLKLKFYIERAAMYSYSC